jgi:hypothetical protein
MLAGIKVSEIAKLRAGDKIKMDPGVRRDDGLRGRSLAPSLMHLWRDAAVEAPAHRHIGWPEGALRTTEHNEPDHQSPITNHQSPITNHQSPITNHQSPITNPVPHRINER